MPRLLGILIVPGQPVLASSSDVTVIFKTPGGTNDGMVIVLVAAL